MKGKLSIFARKTFALVIAISMSFPTGVIAAGEETKTYDQATSIMGLNEKPKEDIHQTRQADNTDKLETDAYIMEARASLDQDLEKISYQVTISNKHKETSDKDLSLKFTPNPNSNITDIKVKSAKAKIENKLADIDIKERSNKGEISSLIVDTKAYDEIIMEVEANVRKAKDARTYETLIGLDDGENKLDLNYRLITNKETVREENQEKEIISLDLNKDPSKNLRGEIKSGEFLSFLQSTDALVWTDYLVNTKAESEKMTYDLKLDDKQDTKDSKISLDYFENTKEGYILKKEFSQAIPFADKIEFEIPAGYIAKLALTTRVDKKNTKTKSYRLNNREVKNPIYIEGNKESSESDDEEGGEDDHHAEIKPEENKQTEDKLNKEEQKPIEKEKPADKPTEIKEEPADKPAEKKAEKKEEKQTDTQITAKDSTGKDIPVIEKESKEENKEGKEEGKEEEKEEISALALNKDSLITRLAGEGKLSADLEKAIEDLAEDLDAYNQGKISDRELKDFTKALGHRYNIEKSDLRSYLESILSGLNKEKNKAANLNYDEIIAYAYPEKKDNTQVEENKKSEEKVEEKTEEKTEVKAEEKKDQTKTEPKANHTEDKTSVKKEDTKPAEASKAVEAYKKDLAKLKEAAKKEEKKGGLIEGIKGLFGQTDLAKADKELKAALANDKNGIEEIQNLLNSFEKKYKLSRADQARLMENNNAAIEALVEKDRNNNFRPHIFAGTESNKLNLEGKKFHILTRFDTSNATGPIQPGQFFNIILDKALTVKPGTKLEPIKYKGEVIAEPKYNSKDNIIEYKIVKEIRENTQFPLNIPVDYNAGNVELDDDGTFTVINKVSGLGLIDPPKDLLPQKVDVNGNPAGSIIEPGRKDVTQIIESSDSNYKVDMDAYANPVVKDGELKGYNWTVKISSDTDLSELGFKANFTAVKGSGLGEISSNDTKVKLTPQLQGAFGIHDSKHHAPGAVKEITYNLYTPVQGMQEKYMMDISVVLTKKTDKAGNMKVGAKRFVVDGWPHDKVKEDTPVRVGINNRTTILGKFASETSAEWTVTDGVSTGDEGTKENPTKLPWETRKLSGNQTITSVKRAVYHIDSEGKMAVAQEETRLDRNEIPTAGTNPSDSQAVGNIAVYEINTSINQPEDKKPQTLAGVAISKYQDVNVEQNWNLGQDLKMPEMTLKAVDSKDENKVLGQTTTTESEKNPDPASRRVTIPNVKVWNIENGGKFSENDLKIKQDFPTTNTDASGNTINYYENNNFYDFDKKGYYIHNKATVQKIPKFANFTLIKKDEEGGPLQGASFKLLGQGEAQVVTDKDGKAQFSNIAPGTYTLMETKAPKGYKLNQEKTTVSVDDDGRISTSGSSAKLSVGTNPTVTVADPNYPDYMNAMQYATKDEKGNVTTYIFLKANEARSGGSTNKDTRISLRVNDGQIENPDDVQVYDVNPDYYRDSVRKAMTQQTVNQDLINLLGPSVLNAPNNNRVIRGTPNQKDPHTGQFGYEITLPKERFARDWGFLVVAKSKPLNGGTNTLSYDWFTSKNTGGEAKLQNQTVNPTSIAEASKGTTITVTNEAFETRPVEIRKIDKKEKPVVGATFEIKDENDQVISTVTSQPADDKGQNAGLASFGKLPEGKYTIEEIAAPEGYVKSDVIFEVTVDDSKQVTYKPKFKDGQGSPVNGEDYLITDEEQAQEEATAKIKNVSQSLVINEGDSGDIGVRPQVWEAYRLESLKYNATIDLDQSSPGQRFSIQFDRNLDFTQYFGEFPKLNIGGVDVADPYFDYTTNKLTYVFNDNSIGGNTQAKIELKGIIPSKYFAQNDGTYNFTVTVAPGQKGITGQQTINTDVVADYEQYDYDGKNVQVPQSYYFRDVYKGEDGKWYVAVLAYYNPVHVRTTGQKELKFNWLSTNYQGATKNFFTWEGNGNKPAFSLRDVKIYRTSPNMGLIHAGNFDKKVNYNMPLSYGVRPSQDPAKYNLVYSKAIDPRYPVNNDRQGSITLNYDPGQIQDFGVITKNAPLKIKMPAIDNRSKDGYIIEQTFKIDDLYSFNNLWRVFCMTNNDFKSSFITRANYNKATGDQAGGELPKFFSQKVALLNKKYVPGSFKIKKLDESDRSKTLQGASFSLTDKDNNVIYRTSGQDGIAQFSNLKPGIYTLKEEKAPDEHIKSDKTWRVNVGIDGVVTIIEIGLGATGESLVGKDTIELPVTNKPVATEFKVYKKDNENVPLQGAKFKITTTDGKQVITTGESDKNGIVSFDKKLENGTYLLEEEAAPAGFKKLDKKWVIEISNNKARVYNYIKGPETGTDPKVNKSILGVEGTKWVNVSKRPTDGWNLGDNRQSGYYNNYPIPFKLGTRIVGKNTKDPNNKYVIQRYVINPEADSLTLNNASIHREKPWFTNMDWYAGNGSYKIFELDKAVDGNVEDIRLENYSLTDITSQIKTEKKVISGDNRLYLDFKDRQITKPIVIDVKIPYTSEDGGVGTGMDLQTNKGLFWKSDYYRRADRIVEGDPVVTKGEGGNIKGAYISEGSLDVNNEKIVQEFSFKKVDDGGNQTDAISGATFSLKGPKKSDQDPGKEVWKKSGKDGMVKFDNLTPGIYHLTESGAPQGYEKSNTDWTVTVTKDGKIYIKDNHPGSTVPDQGATWQKVKAGTSGTKKGWSKFGDNIPYTNRLDTRITEVNKKENKFRQVYIINKGPEKLLNPYFEIHSQEENRPLNLSNTEIISLVKVGSASTPENLINQGEKVDYDTQVYVKKNNQERIKITPKGLPDYAEQTLALTIESSLGNSGNIGTGIDFVNYNGSNQYWMTEFYEDFSKIQLEEATSRSANKNTRTYVGDRDASGRDTVMYANPTSKPVLYSNSGLMERSLGHSLLNSPTPPTDLNSTMNFRARSINTFADGLGIGDEIVGPALRADGWEKVDPNRSRNKTTSSTGSNNKTKITEINKSEGKYRQIFLVNASGEASSTTSKFDFHAEPLKRSIYAKQYYSNPPNIKVLSIRPVESTSTIDNIKYIGTETLGIKDEGMTDAGQYKRYNFRLAKNERRPFVIEVEYDYPKSGEIGLGLDYFTNARFESTKTWAAEKYGSVNDINYKTVGPKTEVKEEEVRTTLPIPKDPERRPNANMKKGEEKEVFAGQEGYQIDIYKVTYIDGVKQPNPEYVRTKEKVDPKPRVIEYGTKDTTSQTYSVWTNSTKLSASPNENVSAGTPVTVKVTPGPNEELDTLTYSDGKKTVDIDKDTKTFTMPASNVTVNATFKAKQKYWIGINGDTRWDVTLDPPYQASKQASKGDIVTFTATPTPGNKITEVTVKKSQGGDVLSGVEYDPVTGKGSFIMPDYSVTIAGTIVTIPQGERTASEDRTEILKKETKVTIDPNLAPGERKVDKPGSDGEVKIRYTATYNIKKAGLQEATAPADWPQDVVLALQNKKESNEIITAYNKVELSRTEPVAEEVRVGKSDDPIDKFVPTEEDKLIKNGETQELVKITNKKAGITLKILKRSPGGEILPGAKFTLHKMTDSTYSKEDTGFGELTASSKENGDVIFTDQGGNEVKLQKGYYVLREIKAPTGYKKSTADWKIEVKDNGGRMYAEYQGPEASPSSFINDNTKSNAGYSADNAGIKYKSRLTYIDPESKTYIQRIYIDTRAYSGTTPLNLQITPKYKREEIDTPGAPPKTIKDGVKTAYFTAYKLSNPEDFSNMNDPKLDKIIRTYDLANDNMSMIKTARWRPFDWGFDEDQLNLDKGVYIVDVEGFYDDVIITGKSDKDDKYDIPQKDLGKIDLHVDFYSGERQFKQLVFDKEQNKFVYKAFKGASYQGGAEALRQRYEDKLVAAGYSKENAKKIADEWAGKKDEGAKYANFVGKEVELKGNKYKTGYIDPAIGNPTVHADTSVNLNPLYNSKSHQEIPREGLEFINEEETFNITFSKHGRKDSKDDVNSEKVTKNRLEGAVFRLEVRGPGGQYEPMPGTTVASAFNGYFGFRGLKPGRYRLMEVKAPEGYKPIKDPVLHFTVAYEKPKTNVQTGEITPGRGVVTLEYNEGNGIFEYAPDKKGPDGKPITPEDGKLVDYVTSATAKNMGKIINEVPGKGKVTLTKYDDDKHLLPGAEFKLTRISRHITDEDPNKNDGVYTKTVGQDGKIVFDELPIGQYELEETKAPKGYQNKGKKWRFTVGGVGLDPYINDSDVGDRDISKSIEMTSKMSVLRPDGNDGTENEGNSKIHPHKGHALSFDNTFKIKDDTAIKAGDYFTIKLTDNIDLEGIMKEKSQNLDLFADGVGTIAKAKYDKEAGTLTYVFTSYADQYNKTDFANTITAHINLMKVKNSTQNVQVGMGIKDTDFTKNSINVDYDLNMAEIYGLNMTSKIVSFDRESGEFVQYFYINRNMKSSSDPVTFRYKPSEDVKNLRVDVINLKQNGYNYYNYNTFKRDTIQDFVNQDMPKSFGVDESSNNLNWHSWYGYYQPKADENVDITLGPYSEYNSFILKVTGQVDKKDIASYDTYAKLFNKVYTYDYYGNVKNVYEQPYVERTNGVRIFENKTSASAKLEIDAINPKNEINFKKIDQDGKILQGAKFKLERYYENTQDGKNWVVVQGSEKTSDKDGLVKYEKLEAGKYALIETEAPEGYGKIEGHIVEFTVGEDGVITRQVVKEKPVEKPQSLIGSIGAMLGSTGDANTETVTEPVSVEPIDVVNYKEIEFEKVDANDKSKKLEGAEFEVHYKEKDTDKDYSPLKVKKTVKGEEQEVIMTVKSGKDGKFRLPISKDGYYALVETKAPGGYTKVPGKIREFKLENGKVQTYEKDPIKASHKSSDKGQISSEIISYDKDKKTFRQRIIINPNHKEITIPSYQSYIRIKENDWKITPKYGATHKDGIGGLVNVAILKKNPDAKKGEKKSIAELEAKDYREVDAVSFTTAGNITGSRYGLKDMLGETSTTDEPLTTTDAIVMEFSGKLDDNNNTGAADQLFELIFDSAVEDNVNDKLNVKALAENKPIYADHDTKAPIQVENKKAEYPFTKSVGTAIFTAIGLFFMVLAGYYYSRKKNKRLEIGNN
ncbi:SpaA isopeptide-forming pilin-related protein [uncultured Anaerococcus sp.]|uniref:SpaA isopeptide-forming pilin-related protein n=1 Tax=uncultured Anaerococcus sp. TaxID=293428 RepID=UPI0025FD959C|nr:SpaA isopeptide-forming pilin-related protein [uncultured Anaerococcus sp.]